MNYSAHTEAFIEYLGSCPWCLISKEHENDLWNTAMRAVDEGYCEVIAVNEIGKHFFLLTAKGEALRDFLNL
jgi:hypothetical protein